MCLKQTNLDPENHKLLISMARGFKTGGRQKGTSNKVTQDVRALLKELVSKEISNIDNLLKDAEPKDRLEFIVRLLPYTLPKFEDTVFNESQETKPKQSFLDFINQQVLESAQKG